MFEKSGTFLLIRTFYLFLIVFQFSGCWSETRNEFGAAISTDTDTIEIGRRIFEQKCAHCHNFKQDAIGPNLGGLTKSVETDWIRRFIRNPFKMVAENDARSIALHKEYKIYMPGFDDFSKNEVDALLSYMHTHTKKKLPDESSIQNSIKNPIPDTLRFSNLTANLEFVAQVPPSSEKPPLARINKLECTGSSKRIFINDLRGVLYELQQDTLLPYLTISDHSRDFIHEPGLGTGLGSFAFHPGFEENGLIYTAHSEKKDSHKADFSLPDSIPTTLQWVISEWKTKYPEEEHFVGAVRELLRIDFVSGMHGVQEIAFNPTSNKNDMDYGMLYIGVGDGGSVVEGYPQVALHDGDMVWGTILRIDPMGKNSKNGQYGIPSDNPFVKFTDKQEEIWAYGLRNPNRITWNVDGKMYASDIGHKIVEEVNKIEPGKFYGWPIREGTFMLDPFENQSLALKLPEDDDDFGVTYPVIQYDHDDGAAISGGFFSREPPFQGKYIFGDIPEGTVFISDFSKAHGNIEKLNLTHQGQKTNFATLTKKHRIDLRFGQDCDGKIYMMTKADGKIYRIVP
ncbi:PQQ-dependent sugar dehydrogenase [Flagellimonas marina]|uniref:PQQ-dependent sugar dehydrogenase n=1 Tax=Flagellimonas marina TaxID=1775168 RepID=A0ABV8PH23_9FLAO